MGAVSNFEKAGIPAVGLSYVEMLDQCADEALIRKVPRVRILPVPRPGPGVSPGKIAEDAVSALLDAITRPLNKDEASGGYIEPPRPLRIAFTGTFDEVQQFFIGDLNAFQSIEPHCKWTDGLPIIPPTEEKIKEFLAHTSHDADEEFDVINVELDVGAVPMPLGLRYKVETVAVNAVMAGCTPEMMPICLAIADTHPGRYITTTASADFGVVTGPIAKKIGMASRRNAMMTGNLANATLGRFMTLIRYNIAQFVPDVTMQHPHGNPLNKGLVFAENYEESLWTNLSEEHGFGRNENTYTRFHTKGLWDYGMSMYGALYSDAYGKVPKLPNSDELYDPPEGDVFHFFKNLIKGSGNPRYFIIIFNPDHIRRLHAKGFKTKDDARQWIWDHCTMTFGEWRNMEPWWAMQFHTATNKKFLEVQGLTVNDICDDSIIHLPLFGKEHINFVHLGSGTPLPTVARGDHVMTVSIDKWM